MSLEAGVRNDTSSNPKPDRVFPMGQTNMRQPRRRAAASAPAGAGWRDVDDLHTDDPFQGGAAAGTADGDARQLIARRRLEPYLEQKRLRGALRDVSQDDESA